MLAFLLLIVLLATIVGSISGIGGGVLIKPVMDAATNLSASQISFMSGTTVLTMTVVSLLRSRKGKEKVSLETLFLAVGAAIGGVAGKELFSLIKNSVQNGAAVSLVQNIVMVILTVLVFIYTLKKDRVCTLKVTNRVLTIIAGLFLGVLSSFLGIGGGPINLMILSYLFSMDTKTAALNSLFVIFFSQTLSLVSSLVTKSIPEFDWLTLILMMALAVVGATLGRSFSKKMEAKTVDQLFLILMAVIILLSLYNCTVFALAL